jgi:hypothetical protein
MLQTVDEIRIKHWDFSTGTLDNLVHNAVNCFARYPAVDSAPIVANLVLLSTNCFYEMKVLRSSHLAQHDCADLQFMFASRLHGYQLT